MNLKTALKMITPSNPFNSPGALRGYFLMLLAIWVLILPPNLRVNTTSEFLASVGEWPFAIINFTAGWWLTLERNGYGNRDNLRWPYALVPMMGWVGVACWPAVTGSGNPISVIGMTIWLYLCVDTIFFGSTFGERTRRANYNLEILDKVGIDTTNHETNKEWAMRVTKPSTHIKKRNVDDHD